ncbi:MAG: excinuclease ABC subunit UvrB [Clostridium sp.]
MNERKKIFEKYNLVSKYKPIGDQKNAIKELTEGLRNNKKFQTLLGVTGSGKTFTVANVIKNFDKPVLILAHNKTLAGQLYSEFKEFFPNNRVEYFVSYYDYYQPEVYVTATDTYIEKETSINDEIDKLRHRATSSAITSNNVIIISSVSCIYGLGDPEDYLKFVFPIHKGDILSVDEAIDKLVDMEYAFNDIEKKRGTYRQRGDILEIYPVEDNFGYRIDFFGDEVEAIFEINRLTGQKVAEHEFITIYPKTHHVSTKEKKEQAIAKILEEMNERVEEFTKAGKYLEAQRIKERTIKDMVMIESCGICNGIENYSRYINQREAGSPPYTLIDYLGDDYILVIDESHVTIPQLRAMYNGDRARKTNLIDYGFRLPSAYDNRPLKFEEFEEKIKQVIFVSATPGEYELEKSEEIVEQIIRPTGLLDPKIDLKPSTGQIDDLITEIQNMLERNSKITDENQIKEKMLVTTLTKKQAEELSDYLYKLKIRSKYLHSDIKSIERLKIIQELRMDKFDVLIGINLLREGLDIPEVATVAILDADKEGFLRSEKSLIQTIGRAARNANGRVILYADNTTNSINNAVRETNRRRKIQNEYNIANGITPQTISKKISSIIAIGKKYLEKNKKEEINKEKISKDIEKLTEQMLEFANNLEFEEANKVKEEIIKLQEVQKLLN